MNQFRHEALLLLGPTGSGKTPLGQVIAERGIHGRCTAHFDFGENLRAAAARSAEDALLSVEDISFLRHVLDTGALLDDKDFPIAERILKWFIGRSAAAPDTLIALNGLPRHTGQAKAIEPLLAASPPTLVEIARLASMTNCQQLHASSRSLPIARCRSCSITNRPVPVGSRSK
jgi:adenylate kinase